MKKIVNFTSKIILSFALFSCSSHESTTSMEANEDLSLLQKSAYLEIENLFKTEEQEAISLASGKLKKKHK